MKKTVLTYGLISGALAAALMLATVPFVDDLGGRKGEIIGYTGIVLAGLLVFFGIRSYRENVGEGRLTFGRGFAVGILITLISAAFYVATWQLVYYQLSPGIGDKIIACQIDKVKASGASQEKIDQMTARMATYKQLLDNPVTNAAVTFIEPFPVGLAITLISAAILRRR